MRGILTLIEILGWAVATWLFVGLVGSLRWLAPGAEAGPEAMLAIALKVVGLVVFVAAWVLSARRSVPTQAQSAGAWGP